MNKWENMRKLIEHKLAYSTLTPEAREELEKILHNMNQEDLRETQPMDIGMDKVEQVRDLLTRMAYMLNCMEGLIVHVKEDSSKRIDDNGLFCSGIMPYGEYGNGYGEVNFNATIEVINKALENLGGVGVCYEGLGPGSVPMDVQLLRDECQALRSQLVRMSRRTDRELLEKVLREIGNTLGEQNYVANVMRKRDDYEKTLIKGDN